jgi:hypothetical protein
MGSSSRPSLDGAAVPCVGSSVWTTLNERRGHGHESKRAEPPTGKQTTESSACNESDKTDRPKLTLETEVCRMNDTYRA